MVKTAGVLTSCKRINSKRTTVRESTASEPLRVNHCEESCKRITASGLLRVNRCEESCKRITESEPLHVNLCEVSREGRKQGKKENIHEICNQA